jgi:3-oxoacyl-[acyl-carrier-protein] synthase-3
VPELTAPAADTRTEGAQRLRGALVGAIGVAVPATVVPNAPIAAHLGVNEQWIVARTGVRERRIAAEGETIVDYAATAAERCLESAGVIASEIDLVLVATMSHDELSPAAAPMVASRIGATAAGAMDVGAACSGFVSALALAVGMAESGRARNVLVVGADLLSKLTDPDDRSTAALFGDGAGAVLVSSTTGPGGVGPAILGADGARADLVTASREEGVLRMKGHDTFRQAVDRLSEAALAAADSAGKPLADIDLFAFHQANTRILAAVGERLGLDADRVIDCIDRYGNTSAATIPLALAAAEETGRLQPGDAVRLAAFGGGLTWAATVIEWEGARDDG